MRVIRIGFVSVLAVVAVLIVSGRATGDEINPRVHRGVVYHEVDGERLRMDIARPPGEGSKRPAIVCLHGGGWTKGHRNTVLPIMHMLAENGYVAAAVSYRLSPKHRFPAHVHDVKAAVRFLRANAERFGIDPDRIGAIGFSAGGHLALMLATTGAEDQLEGDGPHPEQSSRIHAAVNFFGSIDFRTWRLGEAGQDRVRANYGGASFEQVLAGVFGEYDPNAPIMRQASPAAYLDAHDPPMLTFHGTADELVPYIQATEFDAAAKQAGARHRLVTLEGEAHGWTGEKLQESLALTVAFFDEVLKDAGSEPSR